MLQQNLHTQNHQNDASRNLSLLLKPAAEYAPHPYANGGKGKGTHANDAHSGKNRHIACHGQGDAHGKGVNGGGNCHNKHGFYRQIRIGALAASAVFFRRKSLPEHIHTDEHQQAKGHPVVHRLNGFGEHRSQKESDQGHQCLKPAEPDSTGQARLYRRAFHCQALADRHRKSVHAQAHTQQQQFSHSHKKTPPCMIRSAQSDQKRRD